jgi:phage-related protein
VTDVGSARVEVTGDVRSFARQTERDLNRALSKIHVDPVDVSVDEDAARRSGEQAGEALGDGVTRGADGKLRDLRGRFVKEGDRIGTDGGTSVGKAFTKALDRNTDTKKTEKKVESSFSNLGASAVKLFAKSLTGGLSAIPGLIKPGLIVLAIGIGAILAPLVGPAIGAAIAGGILLGAGAGLIGLGVVLLKQKPALVAAATQLTASMKKVFTDAAGSLLKPLVASLGVFQRLVIQIGPAVKQAFSDIAPAIVPFANGLASLVRNALPGFNDLIRASASFLVGIASSLPGLGQSLSNFFGNIAASGPAATIFFQDFIKGIGALIRNLGELIGWLANAYVAVKNFLGGFGPGFFGRAVTALRGLITDGISFVVSHIPDLINGFLAMKSAVLNAAVDLVLGIANALPRIIPVMVANLIQLVTRLVDGLVQAAPKVVEAAGALINGLVDGILKALPTLIPAVVKVATTLVTGIIGLIPIIITAGLRLVQGLIEGILGALPSLALAFISAIPTIVSALLTALPQLLLLGTNLMLAIVQGVANALPVLISAFQTKVFPALLDAIRTQGPALQAQGLNVIQQLALGLISNIQAIVNIITTQIIPAITALFRDNPQFIQAGLDVFKSLLNSWSTNIGLLTTFITGTLVPQLVSFLQNNPQIISAAINMIVTLVNGLAKSMNLIIGFISDTLIPIIVSTIIANAPQLARAGAILMLSLLGAITRSTPQIIGGIISINGAIVSGLLSVVGRVVVAAFTIMNRFNGALVSAGINAARNGVNAVRNAISSAFSGAGSWLADAGRRIIDGLIRGIQSGFDRVRGLLSSLTGLLPDWKGPAEVDSKILFKSGQLVMAGFRSGLEDQRKSIQDTLKDLTGGLPGFTGGPVRGGDGAASGSNVSVTIAPGAIVINGQGKDAGNEAAEAILEKLAQATLVR